MFFFTFVTYNVRSFGRDPPSVAPQYMKWRFISLTSDSPLLFFSIFDLFLQYERYSPSISTILLLFYRKVESVKSPYPNRVKTTSVLNAEGCVFTVFFDIPANLNIGCTLLSCFVTLNRIFIKRLTSRIE